MTPRKRPNYLARIIAVAALLGAFILVIATIATSGGDSGTDKGDSGDNQTGKGPTKEGENAVAEGVWVVQEGDTLVSISEATGVDLDELVSLNPDIDPQTLAAGQRISLRAGETGSSDSSSDSSSSDSTSSDSTSTSSDPAAEFGDGSVADSQ